MKISVNWLKNYVAISLPVEKLAQRLTLAGLEVEKIEHIGDDEVMELEITPNRPDCLNMLGIAREISAVLNKPLKAPKILALPKTKEKCSVTISDREGCSRYIGVVIRDVKVGPSPEWLQKSLLSVGLRPINNIVDITNFVLMETGQPLHAFDHDRLNEGRIVVRRATAGEKLRTLDGFEKQLDPSLLVIADAKAPVALAGIMGGENSEVGAKTKNILLESAYFNPVVIRRGGRKLGISTDSSYRFERGVDLPNVECAASRAVALILELAGGKASAVNDVYPGKKQQKVKPISVSLQTVSKQFGATVTAPRCKTILQKLGFGVKQKGKGILSVVPPSFRADVKCIEDVVEEVARIIGYDRAPSSLPRVVVSDIPLSRPRQIKEKIRQILVGMGFSEIITFTMVNKAALEKTRMAEVAAVRIQNPLSQDQELMRPAILPSFLATALLNLNRGQRDLRLFEVGKIYSPEGEEYEQLAMMLVGEVATDWRVPQRRGVDVFDLKGAAEKLLTQLEQNALQSLTLDSKIFAPGEAVTLKAGAQDIGIVGKVHHDILRQWDIKHTDVVFAQMDLEKIYAQKQEIKAFVAIPAFPAVTRDVSLALKTDVTFAQIRKLATELAGELLTDIRFQELYQGEKIPAGMRGYIFSLVYQSATRTLTEDEVNRTHTTIVKALKEKLGATIR